MNAAVTSKEEILKTSRELIRQQGLYYHLYQLYTEKEAREEEARKDLDLEANINP